LFTLQILCYFGRGGGGLPLRPFPEGGGGLPPFFLPPGAGGGGRDFPGLPGG